METNYAERDMQDALEKLRALLPKGTAVYTILRHVSASGMTRDISVVIPRDGGSILTLDFLIERAGLGKRGPKGKGIRVTGAGMDMGFHVVYHLGRALYRDGYALDHSWL